MSVPLHNYRRKEGAIGVRAQDIAGAWWALGQGHVSLEAVLDAIENATTGHLEDALDSFTLGFLAGAGEFLPPVAGKPHVDPDGRGGEGRGHVGRKPPDD